MNRYSATGLGTTILSNRISHVFNLLGPSLVIDTACSSSLYCLHVACTALGNYECDAAIVAGANLIQSAEQHIGTMKAGVLSPTSECHTFDISADGYGRGEGIGALYIKRLADAIRDGDPIRSVIRGSAVNANGKTTGISLPSADGQEAVIRKALSRGRVDPDDITYVECHGTGTKVGDAIEVSALSRVFRRTSSRPLMIGSVKSNVGHSEAASGIAGVLKATMTLETGLIPPIYGLKTINPGLKVDERHMSIPTTLTAWPENHRVRRIGINSFGYGGANSHVIIEEAPNMVLSALQHEARQLIVPQSSVVIPLSAACQASLETRVADLANFDFSNVDILDLVYTLGSRRTDFPVRGYVVASRSEDIASSFASQPFVTGANPIPSSHNSLPLAFIFTGQGSQWPGMCRELLLEMPVFRNAIVEMDSVLGCIPHAPEWTIQDILGGSTDNYDINTPGISQPLCTAIQVGLLLLLNSWDLTPAVVAGHSSGEIAAAFAAGYISAAEAIVIAYYRGFCVSKNRQDGAMMAVGLGEEKATKEIASLDLPLVVACVNSPQGVTVSGDNLTINQLDVFLQANGTFARKLKTGGQAYHSPHMLAFGNEYQSLLKDVLPTLDPSVRLGVGHKQVTMVSSVTGDVKMSGFNAQYWRSNLESQVRFSAAVQKIQKEFGHHLFVELGPHSSLELPIKQSLAEQGITGAGFKYAAPIKRMTNTMESALSFAGQLWLHGHAVDWSKVNGLRASWKSSKSLWRVVTDLPRYRFNYENNLWAESRASIEFRQRKYPRHELLGSLLPGGSGRELSFRNILKADDVCWFKDHRIEESVVFPGAGYLCMAMEAVMQATDVDRSTGLSFSMENVEIMNALVLPTEPSTPIEIFTSLHKSNLSNAATSSTWWDFTISTYKDGTSASAVTHAKGNISIHLEKVVLEPKYKAPAGLLETTAKRTWYSRLIKSGLNYGPYFQPIEEFQTPRMKSSQHANAKFPLATAIGDPLSVYPVHPVTLDALFQLCNIATANGVPKNMRAHVPTRISSLTVNSALALPEGKYQINALSHPSGFVSANAGAEVVDPNGDIMVQMDGLRLAVIQAGDQSQDNEDERHPILRVLWKPDAYGLGLLPGRQLQKYAQKFADEAHSPVKDDGLLKLGAILDLLVHKNPRGRLLELGNSSHELTLAVLEMLLYQHDFKRLASYTTASFAEDDSLSGGLVDLKTGERITAVSKLQDKGSYDIVIIPFFGAGFSPPQMGTVCDLLADNAVLIALGEPIESDGTPKSDGVLTHVAFPVSDGKGSILVAHKTCPVQQEPQESKPEIVIVERDEQGSRLGSALADVLGSEVPRITLSDLTREDTTIPRGSTVFSLCEAQTPLLATTTDDEMHGIKKMTDNAETLIWVTSGNTLHADRPEFALVSGMARAIKLEQPSLQFYTYDVDQPDQELDDNDICAAAQRLVATISQQRGDVVDSEFAQHENVPHISRFVPDDGLNVKFRAKQGLKTIDTLLNKAGNARLHVQRAGQFDSLFFKQQPELTGSSDSLGHDQVRIKMASVGLNAKDFYVLAGRVDAPDATCQLEGAGTVVEVGCSVDDLSIGDGVVAMAPMHFQTYQTLPRWACHKLQPGENFDQCATLPLVYATAIYALHHRAKIQRGETLLVHSGAGGVGIAAIQLARISGVTVFTTVSTEDKKNYLVDTYGLDPAHVFSSRDTSFMSGILSATNGRGVDVIINSLTGDQLHATWRCIAPFGRFVEIGKLDLATAGRLDMSKFLKNTTFTSFDLTAIYLTGVNEDDEASRNLWRELLSNVLSLYRHGDITAFNPLQIFDVSHISQAFRAISSRTRMGKIAVNLENIEATIPLQPLRHTTNLDPEKSHIMVGCLGGLGRALSRWMVQRGARKFAFLGRSGLDKASARDLVEDLESRGAQCVVVRGDVCNSDDVEAVVAAGAAMGPIGGVVQAAMGLNEAIFSSMPNKYWHTGIDPKVHGTKHLYNAVHASGRDAHLDFFIMTSSLSGSVGTATESNYCAANHFLDAFARHLRNRPDRPVPGAFALGLGAISEVGYLHDNPEIEALLLRKGIQSIDADEFVQIVDLALSSSAPFASQLAKDEDYGEMGIHHAYDASAASHLLTGMEASGLKELRKQGFEGANLALDDPRAGILANALDGDSLKTQGSRGGNGILPTEVVKRMDDEKDPKTLNDALLDHICARFGNLVLMKADSVDVRKPLAEYGMDSMIAAEFKTWFFQNMTVDISLLTLLDKTTSLENLRDIAIVELEMRLSK